MVLEFRLLGDVEALLDGRRLQIGHARQRCVMVALLIDVGHPVAVDQLIDRVWADRPPRRARNALAGYVSRLRQVLAGAGDVRISHQPGGYVLTVDPACVDLYRFRRSVSEARGAPTPAAAADQLDRALNLWRGDPFATLDTPWCTDVRAALLAERFAAELDRNDAALRAGRHAELLAHLPAALQANPLDERLAGQLMLAQSRSGRQADALATFRAIRDRLVDELGVDPGAALRTVHQQVLQGESAPPAPAPARITHELPRRRTSFVGRDAELARLRAALRDGPLVTLTGVGGVGKTSLALQAAVAEQTTFADGVAVSELAPLEAGAAVAHAVLASLRLQQHQGMGVEETVIAYLRPRRVLLVVDNCEHVLQPAAGLVDSIVRECPSVVVLATSREPLGVHGERIQPIPPLTDHEAALLFADRARSGRPDFDLDSEPVGAVAEICRRLDRLPLAIELAAARMRAMGSLDMARRLDGLRLLSGGARGAHPRQQSLAATIDWSFRLLAEEEQELFARLSVFAGGFDVTGAHAVCAAGQSTEDDILDLLTGLVDKSMVTVTTAGAHSRYAVLETLRAFGRERLQDKGIADEMALRHARYFAGLAEHAAAGMHGADEGRWAQRVLPDYDNLRAAFERAMGAGDVDVALRLVTSLSEVVHLRVGYESSEWAEALLPLVDPGHPLFAAAVGFAARGAWNRGEHDRVRSLAALAGGRNPGRGSGRVAYPGDALADVALYEGDPHTALAYYTTQAERARTERDPIRLVWTLFYIAICHAALRTPSDGAAAAEQAVQIADETANPTARSMGRYALGLVLKKTDPDRALALFDEAAELSASVQNFWWHGIALMEAAATRGVHGDPRTAAREFVVVLDHWDRVGDWSQQWLNLRYVARLLRRLGADDDAAAVHQTLVAAGREAAPADGAAAGRPLSGAQAVSRARAALAAFG